MAIHFVLGGAKSGKTNFAEQKVQTLANQSKKQVVYLATATAEDHEMSDKIQRHRAERPKEWQTIEEPILLAETLANIDHENHCIMVDCLTLWLNNLLGLENSSTRKQQVEALFDYLNLVKDNPQVEIVFVSNEVGQGIIPLGELTRQFVTESGVLHQNIAKIATEVEFITVGLPMRLK